jgi:serine palmitoyltransferase
VEHQRLSAAAYTFSAALPALLATTASETVTILQEDPTIIQGLRENIKAMKAQLDPRSDWVRCPSAPENPIMLLVLKDQVLQDRGFTRAEQESVLQDCVDEVSIHNIHPPSQSTYSHANLFEIVVSNKLRHDHPS